MCRSRLGYCAVALAFAFNVAFAGETGPVRSDETRATDDDSGQPIAVLAADPLRAQVAAAGSSGSCKTIGDFIQVFNGTSRYRGNAYRFDTNVTLLEVQMELDIRVSTTLTFSVYRQALSGEWNSVTGIRSIPVSNPPGLAFYSSGPLNVLLPGGFNYVVVFAWGADANIAYGRDVPLDPGYPSATPDSFDIGLILGRVGTQVSLQDPFTSIAISGAGAHSMILCFEPELGACCSPRTRACSHQFETDCIEENGAHFFGERTLCLDNVCDFGACCRPCSGNCDNDYAREACEATAGVDFWSGASCAATGEESLCPPVIGSCCRGDGSGTCDEVCEAQCDGVNDVYNGDGSTCEPNMCVGACCLPGTSIRCTEVTPSVCSSLGGSMKGLGTTCDNLPPGSECGGACCWGSGALTDCRSVNKRIDCSFNALPGFQQAYVGDATFCPANCGALTAFGACCMPDGTCINMPDTTTCNDAGGNFNENAICGSPGLCNTAPCCLPDGSCQRLTLKACNDRTGDWKSGVASCDVAVCPIGACCEGDEGRCVEMSQTACTATGGTYSGDGDDCDEIAVTCNASLGFEFGACCVDGSFCLDALTLAECTERNGDFDLGTTCELIDDDPQLPDCDQRGACCAQTGTCLFITQAECINAPILGTFSAAGTCVPGFCPSGACCHEGGCSVTGETYCRRVDGLDGSYKGPGTECSVNACVPSGACCFNGTCEGDQTPANCVDAGGIYLGDDSTCTGAPCAPGTCCNRGDCTDFAILSECPTTDPGIAFSAGAFCFQGPCEPFGACCFRNGICIDDRSESNCQAEDGVFGQDALCNQFACEPIGACCLRDGTCEEGTSQSDCQGQGGTLFAEQVCADQTCPEIGACCLRDGLCEEDLTREDCEARRGILSPDRTCGQIPLCIPVGACCMPDTEGNRCENDTIRENCQAAGGTYRGDQSDCPTDGTVCGSCCSFTGCEDSVMSSECADIPSEPEAIPFKPGILCADREAADEPACRPRGACCPLNGDCEISNEDDCNFLFGTYAGDGTTCEDSADFCVKGACCDVFRPGTDNCVVRTQLDCRAEQGAYYQGAGTNCDDQTVCTVGSCCPATGFDDCFGNTVISECGLPEDFRSGEETCLLCEGRGACCLENDVACQVVPESQCVGENAVYQGDDTRCPAPEDDDVCFVGACCDGLSECTQQQRFACESGGGLYGGAGTACDPNPCPTFLSVAPESCTIDPAQPSASNGTNVAGITSVTLSYSTDVFGLTIDHFAIETTPGNVEPPAVADFVISGTDVTIEFETPVPAREWTCITDLFYGGQVCVAALPGDVDGNRIASAEEQEDMYALLEHLLAPALPLNQCDIDRSGACAPMDLLREIDLLLGAEAYDVWRGQVLPECPTPP